MTRKPEPDNWNLVFPSKYNRENLLKAKEFRNPVWIPCSVSIFPAVWKKYRGKLRKLPSIQAVCEVFEEFCIPKR